MEYCVLHNQLENFNIPDKELSVSDTVAQTLTPGF